MLKPIFSTPLARALSLAVLGTALLGGCVPRVPVVQVPTFEVQEIRLTSVGFTGLIPSSATLSLKLRVQNPNPFGIRVARAGGSLFLDGQNAGSIELPNVALSANGEATQSADVTLPLNLSNAATFLRAARGEAVSYRVDGTFSVDAGLLGRPTFGPFTLAQGVLRQPRILP
ncbi:LEA type 2 family protein [Deinococcus yavapaiensis]|uniref:LEA14-like dessication related protein n=1 Tax=Deinococcus yavapaiensis KR-236 TaxID=694435 RepID=A0A318SE89_9DEIO|nr:LEA type 2 family protein [Deinococcus yavapaiensis]PYE55858.1 LEA14-like dessication related protein [Deinococcus yavapaiensis KR-236]